ncbi:MAG: ankyrin repeat domain-containing protein [Acetobacteraceae bacterium]
MTLSAFGGHFARAVAALTFLCGGAGLAHAQGIGPAGSLDSVQGQAPSFSKEQLDRSLKGQRLPPAALPGAAGKQAIAPPTRVPTLLSPTEQLFDAINRGDMDNVRDALSRGADLSAPNELGLTPLDLSIDLGRNDISFLLLSMRGASPAQTGPAQPVQTAKATRQARAKAVREAARERPTHALTRTAEAEQAGRPSLPTLFAGNGGTPIPQAGFLGFNGR